MDQTRKRKILAAVFAILGAIIFIAGIIGAIHAITEASGTDSIGMLRSKTRETLSGILHSGLLRVMLSGDRDARLIMS